ncbi:MAG: hypothetical protein WDK96_00565 [Candidatus Paceibacterota bacterium]|jgi:hypothetical protein
MAKKSKKCTDQKCIGHIDVKKHAVLSRNVKGREQIVSAFPCNVCNKLHWWENDNSFTEVKTPGGTNLFLIDGKVS